MKTTYDLLEKLQAHMKIWAGDDIAKLINDNGIDKVVYVGDSCFATSAEDMVGSNVIMPEPGENDSWKHPFHGRVQSVLQGDIVTVMDADDDTFDVEWYRLEYDPS
ncbi:MAG: hypothetical protein WC375_00195 [Methanomassiliicoccales archaeon]|jgi:hypothetical protein